MPWLLGCFDNNIEIWLFFNTIKKFINITIFLVQNVTIWLFEVKSIFYKLLLVGSKGLATTNIIFSTSLKPLDKCINCSKCKDPCCKLALIMFKNYMLKI